MTLKKGTRYNTEKLVCIGWSEGDGTGNVGYHHGDYFDLTFPGKYLGPDEHGIEPLFDDETVEEV